jgi:hypothetical protein
MGGKVEGVASSSSSSGAGTGAGAAPQQQPPTTKKLTIASMMLKGRMAFKRFMAP